jgi:hypothetical protein
VLHLDTSQIASPLKIVPTRRSALCCEQSSKLPANTQLRLHWDPMGLTKLNFSSYLFKFLCHFWSVFSGHLKKKKSGLPRKYQLIKAELFLVSPI